MRPPVLLLARLLPAVYLLKQFPHKTRARATSSLLLASTGHATPGTAAVAGGAPSGPGSGGASSVAAAGEAISLETTTSSQLLSTPHTVGKRKPRDVLSSASGASTPGRDTWHEFASGWSGNRQDLTPEQQFDRHQDACYTAVRGSISSVPPVGPGVFQTNC